MPYMNHVVLLGHAGRDAEDRTTPSGTRIVKFSLATTKKWKGKDGQPQERTDWHNIVCFSYTAKDAAAVMKGDTVMVIGSVTNNSWEKDGVKKQSTAITADHVFIRPVFKATESVQGYAAPKFSEEAVDFVTEDKSLPSVDDLPF